MDEQFERYLSTLRKTEWMPASALAKYQQQLLARLVRHAYENVPFYRSRLACLIAGDGTVDLSRWREVPVLERTEAAANMAAMQTSRLPDGFSAVRKIQTSGTLDIPLKFTVDGLSSMASNAALTRFAHWHGLDTARPLAAIRVYEDGNVPRYPEGGTARGWSRDNPESVVFRLELRTPVDQQLEWLERRKAGYLATSPSNAMALAYAASPNRVRGLGIEFIIAGAETVLPDARELAAERFGARLAAIYSCQEVGYIAIECPAAPHYHVMSEHVVVELVAEDGSPVAPGEIGRVVLTGLYGYATPFIRYAIGDVATADAAPCRCGRSLPVIQQIDGRTRSAFVFKDGTRVWPRAWHARELRAIVPFREFQLVQLSPERVEFRYVPDGAGGPPDLGGLQAFARSRLHPAIEIAAVAMQAVPRGPGGKLENFVSLVSGTRQREDSHLADSNPVDAEY